jgi:purine-binding chemotaxis protein CheW
MSTAEHEHEDLGSALDAARASFEAVARRAAGRGTSGGEEHGAQRELLVLWLGADPYALPVERVREIVRMRSITPVPRVPAAVRGVLSLRGEIVQVIDLRSRLGMPPNPDDAPRRRIVVLNGEEGQLTGLLVDRVSEVLRLRDEELRPPAARDAATVSALAPHGEGFLSVFDVERVLDLSGA